ncbi:MAG: metallophosphoesterase family protein [Caldilineaceae bacterium]|nr:metallophosphoesterase family protein [Caldilineaceae bacterium]
MNTPILRLAFLADIHGNLPALEAVLADVRAQAPDAVYLVGDQINRCPWHNEVLDLLDTYDWPAIAGNHELVIGIIGTPHNYPPFTDRNRFAVLWWTWETLAPRHLRAIRTLPEQLHIHIDGAPPILMTHGTPGDAEVGFYPGFDDDTMRRFLVNVDEPVIVAAHTHRPLDRDLGRWRVFNGGAVGLPYNGDPRAQYLLLDLEMTPDGPTWTPRFRQVDYDRLRVADAFVSSGLLDAAGPLARLDLRTVQTGHPWTSDFGVWMRSQPKSMRADMSHAVDVYLRTHGPGNWAFDEQRLARR